VADQQSNDVFELYSVLLGGGAFVKLSPTPVLGGDVLDYNFDPVSDRVVYRADLDTNDLIELYSVPITGGSSVKLNPPIPQDVVEFEITPGAAYVMFIARQAGTAYQLYGNDTTGGSPRLRSLPLSPGENVISFKISPTGMLVVYDVGTNNSGFIGNLYRADPYAGDSQALSIADPDYGVSLGNYFFTPDGEHIVCKYQLNAASPVKLQALKTSGFPVSRVDLFVPDPGHAVGSFRISPDSQWVVYEDYVSSSNVTLHAIPAAGGSPVTLGMGDFSAITPDSQRVIYNYPPHGDHSDLMSIQIFGGGLRNLSRMDSTDYAFLEQISPDGQWIVFQVQLNSSSGTIGYQLRVSDGNEAPLVFYTYLPLVQK